MSDQFHRIFRGRVGAGFTLIEICVALFLAMALFTLAIGIVKMGMKDSALIRLRDEVGLLVLRTRALAMESGREQEFLIRDASLALETGEETMSFPRTVEVPPEVKMEVQIWPDDRWIVPKGNISTLFPANGICLPISFRFSQDESFVSFRIHPLTGAVDQESRTIEGEK
jgi:hypothetical protein